MPGERPSWATAREVAHAAARLTAVEHVALAEAAGRVLAEAVVAPTDLPHYDSSAMDGWAVSGPGPWTTVRGPGLTAGTAVAVVTGELIPPGATAVVRRERAVIDSRGQLSLAAGPGRDDSAPGSHIRRAGEEARAGEVMIGSGTPLNPVHLSVAAACGLDRLAVRSLPWVRLALTGDEVLASGPVEPGRVRDSFGPSLPSLVGLLRATIVGSTRVPDELAATVAALGAKDCELLITTGGTGGSHVDHLRSAVAQLGGEILIDGIAMKPGGPTTLARLIDGRLVLSLPGNPLAAILGLLVAGGPLLASMAGLPLEPLGRVRMAERMPPAGAVFLRPYTSSEHGAVTTEWHGSAMLRGLAEADGVLVVPEEGLDAGAEAQVIPLPWLASAPRATRTPG